jgi:DMSO reductase anchor subunit
VSKPKLQQRIQQVLTEARVVLPGAQAMLGFQLSMMLMDAFEKLSGAARLLHFASLCCVALATVMLMAPAAFHRIAERGEDTERLERFSGAMILAAMVALAAGLSLDLAVVTERWNGSLKLGVVLAVICFAALMAGWFGLMLALRVRAGSGTGPA